MGSCLNIIGPPCTAQQMGKGTAGKVAPLPALSPLCWFGPSELVLIFQVGTGAREEEGVTSFQRF